MIILENTCRLLPTWGCAKVMKKDNHAIFANFVNMMHELWLLCIRKAKLQFSLSKLNYECECWLFANFELREMQEIHNNHEFILRNKIHGSYQNTYFIHTNIYTNQQNLKSYSNRIKMSTNTLFLVSTEPATASFSARMVNRAPGY